MESIKYAQDIIYVKNGFRQIELHQIYNHLMVLCSDLL